MTNSPFVDSIFEISTDEEFREMCLKIFNFQYTNLPVYRKFCDLLSINVSRIRHEAEIPFLPIQFFKTHKIVSAGASSNIVFTSSGTTGQITSRHYVADITLYERAFLSIFHQFYGDPREYIFLALLPSYLEREGSSLIYMVQKLIEKSGHEESGFYLHNLKELSHKLRELDSSGKKIILLGVSYALLDLIEEQKFSLQNTIVMETGGMKGKRKEMVKEELHAILREGFGVPAIHSEYGMTELLSQAYSNGGGIFGCPPWMKILTRNPEDPLTLVEGKTGGINVIDLANINSCSFIATQDLGVVYPDNSFEIKGRFDNSDIRGCNLMVL